MERNHSSPSELGVLRKHRGEQSAYFYTHLGIEVAKDELRVVIGRHSVMIDILLQYDVGEFEDSEPSCDSSNHEFPSSSVANYHHMGVVHILRKLIDLFEFELLPGIIVTVREHDHQLLHKVVEPLGRLIGGCEHYLYGSLLGEILLKFIHRVLRMFVNKMGLGGLLLVFDCFGLLPLIFWQLLSFLSSLSFDAL